MKSHLQSLASVIPFAVAKLEHPWPLEATAYSSQSAGMPDCVGPGGVTEVVVALVVVVVEARVVASLTQYASPTSRYSQVPNNGYQLFILFFLLMDSGRRGKINHFLKPDSMRRIVLVRYYMCWR
jgi:hypothetical protein